MYVFLSLYADSILLSVDTVLPTDNSMNISVPSVHSGSLPSLSSVGAPQLQPCASVVPMSSASYSHPLAYSPPEVELMLLRQRHELNRRRSNYDVILSIVCSLIAPACPINWLGWTAHVASVVWWVNGDITNELAMVELVYCDVVRLSYWLH